MAGSNALTGNGVLVETDFTAIGPGRAIFVPNGQLVDYAVLNTSGFSGKVVIEKSEDGGQNWIEIAGFFSSSTAGSIAAASNKNQGNSHYRFRCITFGSGVIKCQLQNQSLKPNFGNDVQANSDDQRGAPIAQEALLRLGKDIVIMSHFGPPLNGVTGAGFAGACSLCFDTQANDLYINTMSLGNPVWKRYTHS